MMSWVLDHSRSKHGARLVLIAVANCMNTPNSWAWPSNKELQRQTNLTERAVRLAVAELIELGELAVDLNSGPGGCNRYRVITTVAPRQILPPAKIAPLKYLPPGRICPVESVQLNGHTPAKIAPPAEFTPRQHLPHPPAKSAPGTVIEPKEKISPTERSTSAETAEVALFVADDNAAVSKARRGRPVGLSAAGPLFAEWYAAYPVHKARGDAEKAWAKAMREGADASVLIAAAKRYRDDPLVIRGYGKHPATWLNAKCWLDEPTQEPDDYRPPGRGIDRRQQATADDRVQQALDSGRRVQAFIDQNGGTS